tara:strand:- start:1613 stop:1834 length:222 start_codon:yes stop_codon:yes gene_type:complete
MKLIDTPNPNAKKIELDTNSSVQDIKDSLYSDLMETEGVLSVFFGPNFITITKEESGEWKLISQDIYNIFDKL